MASVEAVDKGKGMKGKESIRKIALVVSIAHLLEALFAMRMARRRGKSAALYLFPTLFVSFTVLLRLRRVEPAKERV